MAATMADLKTLAPCGDLTTVNAQNAPSAQIATNVKTVTMMATVRAPTAHQHLHARQTTSHSDHPTQITVNQAVPHT